MGNLKQIRVRKLGIKHSWSVSNLGLGLKWDFNDYIDGLGYLFKKLNFLYSNSVIEENVDHVRISIFLSDWRVENYLLSRFFIGLRTYRLTLQYLSYRRRLPLDVVNQDSFSRLVIAESIIMEAGLKYYSKPVKVEFFILDDSHVSSGLILNYISEKLKQGAYLKTILNRLNKNLLRLVKQERIGGFYILCKGRYSKASRASKINIVGGYLGFSSLDLNIEYSENMVILKYGTVSISVWILKNKMKDYCLKVEI